MACGLSRSFTSLFLARVGIGAGEATLNPAGTPLIADYFPPEKRARAFSIFLLGSTAGSGLSYLIGGSVINLAAWFRINGPDWIATIPAWKIVFFSDWRAWDYHRTHFLSDGAGAGAPRSRCEDNARDAGTIDFDFET